MRPYRALLPGLALLGLVSLAAQPAHAQKGDRNRLTAEEIAEKDGISTALDAVKRLRPNWLRVSPSGIDPLNSGSRGNSFSTGKPEPAVYLDEARVHGGVAALREIRVGEIAEMAFLSGSTALARYGNGHDYGAILVKTTRQLP